LINSIGDFSDALSCCLQLFSYVAPQVYDVI